MAADMGQTRGQLSRNIARTFGFCPKMAPVRAETNHPRPDSRFFGTRFVFALTCESVFAYIGKATRGCVACQPSTPYRVGRLGGRSSVKVDRADRSDFLPNGGNGDCTGLYYRSKSLVYLQR